MRRVVLVLCALTMVAAACGDSGGDDESREALVAAVKQGILDAAADDDDLPIADAEAQCVAEQVVDDLGTDGVVALGLSAEGNDDNPFVDATLEQKEAVVDAMLDCVDFKNAILPTIQADGVSEESAECVVDEMLAADFFRPALVDSLSGEEFDFESDPEVAGQLVEVVLGCLTPEELSQLGDG